jgi:DNA-binding MarR family transcriptional regulator
MTTSGQAFAVVAEALAGVDPRDREAVTSFYRRKFVKYPPPVRALISDFLIGQSGVPSADALKALKAVVALPIKDVPEIGAPVSGKLFGAAPDHPPTEDRMAIGSSNTDQLMAALRGMVVGLVRRDGVDLSALQLAVFLTSYLRDGSHTVRGLAAELHVSRAAISRVLDRLGALDLARRKVDPLDRRSVLVQRTPKGAAFLRDVRKIIAESANPKTQPAKEGLRAVG